MTQTLRMGTATGKTIWFLEPERLVVDPEDLFRHGRNQRRYAGAIDVPLLFHWALVVELGRWLGHNAEQLAYDASHDLHEAYVLDIPTPLKQVLPEYEVRIERPMEAHVHRSLGLQWEVPPRIAAEVKVADLRALVVESTMKKLPFAHDIAQRWGKTQPEEAAVFCRLTEYTDYELWAVVCRALRDGGSPLFQEAA